MFFNFIFYSASLCNDKNESQQPNIESATQKSTTVCTVVNANRSEAENSSNDSNTSTLPREPSIVSTSSHTPTDISSIGSDWKKQTFSKKYFPKDRENRSFQPQWVDAHDWIEYSEELDAVFCYACRQFAKSTSKDDVFIKTGFRAWKFAKQKKKGFDKHSHSAQHILSMSTWKEKLARRDNSIEISNLLSNDVLEKRRYYIKSLIGVVKFLAANELPFRGNWNDCTHEENGLFTNMFKYTVKKDNELKKCLDVIPRNAMYTSPEIQNELIGTMADLMRQQIVLEVNSADAFTLLVDGTKDKNKNEIISIAARYVIDSKPKESLLSFEKSDSLCAEPMAEFILSKLTEYGLDLAKLISQCYDGANVMSGGDGGIQTIIQRKLNRVIPYVHCFNHRFVCLFVFYILN